MPGYVDNAQTVSAGQIQVSEPQFNGNAPFLFLLQSIRLDTGQGPDETGLAVIHMTGGAEDNFTHAGMSLSEVGVGASFLADGGTAAAVAMARPDHGFRRQYQQLLLD